MAALQGAAIGLGATVVLACDAVVAARATFADTVAIEAGRGRRRNRCLAGRRGDAAGRAATCSPVTGSAPRTPTGSGWSPILSTAPTRSARSPLGLARRIAAHAPLAVELKRALNELTMRRAAETLETALAREELTLGSPDLREGIDAFRERRVPNFTGRRS